nr:protein translocase subunit SecD [Verrucomicrobiota bacterium]
MTPALVFCAGLVLLVLFGWYFFTESERIKRIVASVLTVLLVALCLEAMIPPFDVKDPNDPNGKLIKEGRIPLGLDLKGGTSFLIRLVADESGEKREITPTMVDQAVEVIRKRVDKMGTREPVITPTGSDRILVQIPGLDTERLKEAQEQLHKVAKLEFRMVHPNSDAILAGEQPPDPNYKVEIHTGDRKGKPFEEQLLVKRKADIPGDLVSGAFATFDVEGWGVNLRFNSKGADLFGKLTAENVGNRFAIVLDGEIQSAPVINEPIYGGTASISGDFSETEARTLASVLENPLATPVVIDEQRSASATLGADSIKSGVYAGLLGLALTVVCVLAYYRLAGVVALVALAINGLLLFGAMGMFGAVLTLPGIAGIILTLGMAIDANVLIYERLREEMAAGKSLKASIEAAYDKAFSAIFDSNVTTLITAGILSWQATGPVKGFAVTLALGIIASMFSALVVTRNVFDWVLRAGLLKKISMTDLIGATNINFLGFRRLAIGLSAAVILALAVVFVMRGQKNFGVDFRGGDRLVLEAQGEKVAEAQVRQALDELQLADSVVQIEKSAAAEFVTIRSPHDTGEKIEAHLKQKFPEAKLRLEQAEKVGSLVGGELARNSLIALGLGMVGILIYVAVRFEFSFAVGAIVALLHDVLITIGAFALFGREMSLI